MKRVVFILACLASMPAQASEAVVSQVLEGYRAEGAGEFSAERGKTMWTQTHNQQGRASRSAAPPAIRPT